MTDLTKLAESLTPCHCAARWSVMTDHNRNSEHYCDCSLHLRRAILAALARAHAAGVAEGLEMAAKWHDWQYIICQRKVGLTTGAERKTLLTTARVHSGSAASIRALKPPSKETECE